jgi:hypothetical protein
MQAILQYVCLAVNSDPSRLFDEVYDGDLSFEFESNSIIQAQNFSPAQEQA